MSRELVIRALRRTTFVPLVFAVAAVSLSLFPLTLTCALVVDAVRRRRMATTRMLLIRRRPQRVAGRPVGAAGRVG